MHAAVEDMDGVIHRASCPASTKRINKRVTRRGSVCGRNLKGMLRDPATVRVTCMECLADERTYD